MCLTPAFPVSPETPYGKKEEKEAGYSLVLQGEGEGNNSIPCCIVFFFSSENFATLPSVQPTRAPAEQPSQFAQRAR